MSKVLICDIDGVVCDSSIRLSKYSDCASLERGDYDSFIVSMHVYNSVTLEDDVPILPGIDLFRSLLSYHNPSRAIFLTSRAEVSRANTLSWLRTHVHSNLLDSDLIMQSGGKIFCPIEYKRNETVKLLDNHNIVIALDDHLPICDMYQSLGIPSLYVKFPGIDCIVNSGMTHDMSILSE